MKLTKGLRQKILERFRDDNESIAVIADWYGQAPKRIEDVIREGMKSAHGALLELAIDRAIENNGELRISGAKASAPETLVDP